MNTSTTTARLNLDELVCAQVLHSAALDGPPRDLCGLFGTDAALLHGTARDVLYIPELRLQVLQGRLVPQEAIAEPWTLEFEKKREFLGAAARYTNDFPVARDERHVCILSNFYSRNFYHWLTEEMLKVAVLEKAGWDGSYVVQALPKFASEFLQLVGVSPGRLISDVGMPTVFGRASFTTSIHGANLFAYKSVFDAMREGLLHAALVDMAATPRRRLWLERRQDVNNAGRDLENAHEVNQILARYGVESLDIATLSVPDQIRTAAQTHVLSGVHGAGFVHSTFMPPRSSLIECFSPLYINPSVLDICRLLRHRHHMLVYEQAFTSYPYGKRVKVNPVQLDLAFRSILD
jgi:hypothetical protein